jgi:predicted phosphodiesterase
VKLLILSDLHLEFGPLTVDAGNADVVILAGDIHLKTRGVTWAIETFRDRPVIMVFGNHEYYGEKYPTLIDKAKALAAGSNVYILEDDTVDIDGVRFLGCTLWTDFRLYGDPRLAGYFCQQVMTDFKKIRVAPRYSKLNPVDVTKIHETSLNWLKARLSEEGHASTVVVTHHAPSARSLPIWAPDDLTGAAYASHLDQFVEEMPIDLWVHGHLHNNCDYLIGNTRVVCNARGYFPEHQNSDFAEYCIVNI